MTLVQTCPPGFGATLMSIATSVTRVDSWNTGSEIQRNWPRFGESMQTMRDDHGRPPPLACDKDRSLIRDGAMTGKEQIERLESRVKQVCDHSREAQTDEKLAIQGEIDSLISTLPANSLLWDRVAELRWWMEWAGVMAKVSQNVICVDFFSKFPARRSEPALARGLQKELPLVESMLSEHLDKAAAQQIEDNWRRMIPRVSNPEWVDQLPPQDQAEIRSLVARVEQVLAKLVRRNGR